MPLTDEQAKFAKEQVLKQLDSSEIPEEKKNSIKKYINEMNNEQLEEFLIKNNMMQQESDEQEGKEQEKINKPENKSNQKNQCIYCLLAKKQVESLPIYEDSNYLAALEINPFSEGQIILIPKEHTTETKKLKSKALVIANKIGKHLVKKLKAENFQITTSDELKHAIINIIPVYKDKPLKFERKPAQKPHLQELAMKIGKIEAKTRKTKPKEKKETKVEKTEEKSKPSLPQYNRRIP